MTDKHKQRARDIVFRVHDDWDSLAEEVALAISEAVAEYEPMAAMLTALIHDHEHPMEGWPQMGRLTCAECAEKRITEAVAEERERCARIAGTHEFDGPELAAKIREGK